MARRYSEGRKWAYYAGAGILFVGILVFLSSLVVVFSKALGNDSIPDDTAKKAFIYCGVVGFALAVTGSTMQALAKRGLAGSGVILDPERASQDLEPLSRQAGRMLKDALDEANVNLEAKPATVVKIKCRSCGTLNEEHSKFCRECGTAI